MNKWKNGKLKPLPFLVYFQPNIFSLTFLQSLLLWEPGPSFPPACGASLPAGPNKLSLPPLLILFNLLQFSLREQTFLEDYL